MANAVTSPGIPFDEYLRLERSGGTKHEWLDGVVYAMAGGSPEHARIASYLGRLLGNALEGRPCATFSSDLLVRVLATGLATYPDVTVICGKLETDPDSPLVAINPTLLIEVLSESTEAYDRGEKFAHYRQIPALREYVLASPAEKTVEVYRRNEDGTWTLHEPKAGRVLLASLEVEIEVDPIFADPLG